MNNKNLLSVSHAYSLEMHLPVKDVPWLLEAYVEQKIHGCLTGTDCARETTHLPVNVLSGSQAISPEMCLPLKDVPWRSETYMDQKMRGCLIGGYCARETGQISL